MSSRGLAALALGVGLLAGSAQAKAPNVSLTGGPARAVVGQPWRATLAVRPASAGRPSVTLRGPSVRVAAVRALAAGRYRVEARFPAAGSWRVEARLAGKTFRLRAVAVRAPGRRPITLRSPTLPAIDTDGNLLVPEQQANRIVRIEPTTGRLAVAAPVVGPYGLALDATGAMYVSSDNTVVRIAPGGARRELGQSDTGLDIGPVAVDAAGDVYWFADNRISRWSAATGQVTRYGGNGAQGFDGDGGPVTRATFGRPHGLAFAPDGALIVSDSENNRIRRVDPDTQIVTTIASGIRFPAGVAVGRDGAIYSVGLSNTLVRIGPDGSTRQLATGLRSPLGVAVAADGTIYVTEGDSGHILRIDQSGRISTLTGGA